MVQPIDERRNVEDQIVRNLHLEIGRGTYRAGELLPPVESLARDLLINPRKVTAAYEKLCTEGVASFNPGEGFRLKVDAAERTRLKLLEDFEMDLRATLQTLRQAGCPAAQTQEILQTAQHQINQEGTFT